MKIYNIDAILEKKLITEWEIARMLPDKTLEEYLYVVGMTWICGNFWRVYEIKSQSLTVALLGIETSKRNQMRRSCENFGN
jgi:hypothetical protein